MDTERPLDAAPEPAPDPVFESLSDAFNLPPELAAEVENRLEASAVFQSYSQDFMHRAGQFGMSDPRFDEMICLSNHYADLSTTLSNGAEALVKSYDRKQKVRRAAGRVLGIIRKPLDLPWLGNDTAAEALPPAVENG